MANDSEVIQSIRAQSLAQIQAVRAAPKPSYWLDGHRVLWQEYVESLQRTVDWCDAQLAMHAPYEVRSEGRSL